MPGRRASARRRWRRSWPKELGVGFRATSGPVIAKAGDLAALLTNLEDRDVLFIDEIHRLSPAVEEILYPALEDFQLDLIIGEGPAARSVRIDLAKFTLVGATTRLGLLTTPLRDRFGIPVRLNFYSVEELERVVTRAARVLAAAIGPDGAHEIARRARGTPAHRRPAAAPRARLRLRRRRADHRRNARRQGADRARGRRRRPRLPRSPLPRAASPRTHDGGPVGIETIAAALSEPRDALEEIVEPYLLQQGFISRTPRGRIVTLKAYRHLGMSGPQRTSSPQGALFDVLE